MREDFYEMIEKVKKEFQMDFKQEDLINFENKLFNINLSDNYDTINVTERMI